MTLVTVGPNDRLRVFLTMPTRTIFRSTDRQYIYERFVRLGEHWPLDFQANQSLRLFIRQSVVHVSQRLLGALGRSPENDGMYAKIRIPNHADLVYSYGLFPDITERAAKNIPVVWEHTFAPVSLDVRRHELIAHLRKVKKRAANLAHRVVTATSVSAEYFAEAFPEAASKIRIVPYYFPDIEPVSMEQLANKTSDFGPIRLLFVGKQARRKGLDVFAEAWSLLPQNTRNELDVTVVSAMIDGPVSLPGEWHQSAFVPNLAAQMEAAHALVFPTKHEAFGLVLVEAMAKGCLALTTSAPIQRSIVTEQAGVFFDPRDPRELARALERLVEDRAGLRDAMTAARAHFMATFHHSRVGETYAAILWEAAGRGAIPLNTGRNIPLQDFTSLPLDNK